MSNVQINEKIVAVVKPHPMSLDVPGCPWRDVLFNDYENAGMLAKDITMLAKMLAKEITMLEIVHAEMQHGLKKSYKSYKSYKSKVISAITYRCGGDTELLALRPTDPELEARWLKLQARLELINRKLKYDRTSNQCTCKHGTNKPPIKMPKKKKKKWREMSTEVRY